VSSIRNGWLDFGLTIAGHFKKAVGKLISVSGRRRVEEGKRRLHLVARARVSEHAGNRQLRWSAQRNRSKHRTSGSAVAGSATRCHRQVRYKERRRTHPLQGPGLPLLHQCAVRDAGANVIETMRGVPRQNAAVAGERDIALLAFQLNQVYDETPLHQSAMICDPEHLWSAASGGPF